MKTLLILSDGMRPRDIEGHEFIEKLKAESTYCMRAQTVMPSVTLPCHMSLFHSVDPDRHGVTTNTYMPQVRPIDGLFEVLSQAGNKCAILYNWEQLKDLSRPGSLARSDFQSAGKYGGEQSDLYHCEHAKEWCKNGDIDFMFLYLGWVDGAGHGHGWGSDFYMDSINKTLNMAKDVIEALKDKYTIYLTADHGGHDRSHGHDIPEDMEIPLFCYGDPFEKGKELKGLNIKDIAPTIATLHGARIPEEWEGNIIK